jgi:hypothetical protein
MASAKLEILISAKETATQVMAGVKGAFQRRAMEISAIGDGMVKHGEKIEKFLHGVSLLKLATEQEGVKKSFEEFSPTLQKLTSDMLNYGLAIGGTLSLLKDLSHLSRLGAAGPLGFIAAVGSGTVFLGQSYLDAQGEKRAATANGNRMAFGIGEAARNARSGASFDLAIKQLQEAAAMGIEDAQKISNELAGQRDAIVARNKAMDAGTALLWKQTETLRRENEASRARAEALVKVREILAERDRQTPLGQMREFNRVNAELQGAQAMNINPEANPQLWLEREKQVAALTEELKKLNEGPIGKLQTFGAMVRDRALGLLRPSVSASGDITTRSVGTLPAAPNLGDSLSRLGLFAGGGRSNTLTGLSEQKLTSIDSVAKQQVEVLKGIWRTLTDGNTYRFGQ